MIIIMLVAEEQIKYESTSEDANTTPQPHYQRVAVCVVTFASGEECECLSDCLSVCRLGLSGPWRYKIWSDE